MTSPALASPTVRVGAVHTPEVLPRPRAVSRCLYLLGRPTLKGVIRFVRDNAVDRPSTAEVIDRWQKAKALVDRLQVEEAGRADAPRTEKLGPDHRPFLVELLKDPLVKHGFNTLPTEFAMVPLDQLVVYQRHIDLTHVERLVESIGPAPDAATIFRTCLPAHHPAPPVEWCQVDDKKYVFQTLSNDLRFLGTMALEPGNITEYPPPGSLVGVVGLAVGFGSNFLNVVKAEGRLILTNGSHRAYALRSIGVTHAPCIVQHANSRDELELVASTQVRKDPDLYLKTPRPSMLPDYFHPELQITLPVHQRTRQVTVRFEVEEEFVPVL